MIQAVPVRILRRALLVMVSAEVDNRGETPPLHPRVSWLGRHSVDIDVVPSLDQRRQPASRPRLGGALAIADQCLTRKATLAYHFGKYVLA